MYIMVLVKRKFTTVLILIPWNTPGRCDCFSITPIVPSGNSCFWLTMTYVKNNDQIKRFNEILAGRVRLVM